MKLVRLLPLLLFILFGTACGPASSPSDGEAAASEGESSSGETTEDELGRPDGDSPQPEEGAPGGPSPTSMMAELEAVLVDQAEMPPEATRIVREAIAETGAFDVTLQERQKLLAGQPIYTEAAFRKLVSQLAAQGQDLSMLEQVMIARAMDTGDPVDIFLATRSVQHREALAEAIASRSDDIRAAMEATD